MAVNEILQSGTKVLVKHSPKILTALGISGMFGTILWAIKQKDDADLRIKNAKAEKAADQSEDGSVTNIDDITLTPVETVKAVFPAYWGVGLSFALSAAAIIGSDYISDKRQVALSAAYTIADMSLKEFQKKTEEVVGEKKMSFINQKVAQDQVDKNPPDKKVVEYVGLNTQYSIFLAPYTNVPFVAKIDDVKAVFNRINSRLNYGDQVSLNEILADLNEIAVDTGNGKGVTENRDIGDMFYWDINESGLINVDNLVDAALVPDTEIPCLKINLHADPIFHNYR